MSPKTHLGSKKCEKLHEVIFSHICLKIRGNYSGVFSFLRARNLKQNCKPIVSKVKKKSRDLMEKEAGALPIHIMKDEGAVFQGGSGAYLEDLKPILSYSPIIWKRFGRFLLRARSLFRKPGIKCEMPTCNMEREGGVFHAGPGVYFKDMKLILPYHPEILSGKESFSMVDQVFIWKTWNQLRCANL